MRMMVSSLGLAAVLAGMLAAGPAGAQDVAAAGMRNPEQGAELIAYLSSLK